MVWAWWREVNPIDGEVSAGPWANLGLVDIHHADERRASGAGRPRRCSRCQATWRDALPDEESRCFVCDRVPDDDWSNTLAHTGDGGIRTMGTA